jgi:ABC-type amino acid transport substrate-binding protein
MKSSLSAGLIACIAIAMTSVTALAQSDTLKKIKETKAVTLGYRESSIPFSYLDADLKPVGFSMDLCGLIVERIKQQTNLQDKTVRSTLSVAARPIMLHGKRKSHSRLPRSSASRGGWYVSTQG